MHRPITVLLSIVVLAHSLAGCCCHHAHAAEAGAPATCCAHEYGHGHPDGGADENCTDSESPAQLCEEGSCVFVRTGGSPSVESTLALALDGCAATVSEVGLDGLRISRAAYPDSQDLAPHTRLHLLHQILLI